MNCGFIPKVAIYFRIDRLTNGPSLSGYHVMSPFTHPADGVSTTILQIGSVPIIQSSVTT